MNDLLNHDHHCEYASEACGCESRKELLEALDNCLTILKYGGNGLLNLLLSHQVERLIEKYACTKPKSDVE